MSKTCWFCGQMGGKDGCIPAKALGLPEPPPNLLDESFDIMNKTITIHRYGLPCPICNYEALTKEQVAFYISILASAARERNFKENETC